MTWIILSLIYGIFNALYIQFNAQNRFNGYILGIWRGFGITLITLPLLIKVPFIPYPLFYLILIFQGIMIGIYDSHIFFASSRYGSTSCLGFMTTSVLITTFMWWGIDLQSLTEFQQTPKKFITLMIILCGFTVSYWHMMRVHLNKQAEAYLYPAVLALALMSIATKYIAIQGGQAYVGVTCYLVISCFVSGIYNLILFILTPTTAPKRQLLLAPLSHGKGIKLIFFSIILITAKTLALRKADNPGYVMVFLMLSPFFTDIIQNRQVRLSRNTYPTLFFLILFLLWLAS